VNEYHKKLLSRLVAEYEDGLFGFEGFEGPSQYRINIQDSFREGFKAAYNLLNPPSVERRWEIAGGDTRSTGYSEPFKDLNAAYEALEFLIENQPGNQWEIKEIK